LAQAANLPGAARLELVDGVIHLDPKPALFDAMLAGWVRQQQTRFLKEDGTIRPRIALVRRLAEFTNAYPWEWTPSDVEAFFSYLRSSNGRNPIQVSTGRGYKQALSVFMEYITDQRYGWPEACLERFGDFPQQIFHEDNSIVHASEYEGRPGRRPLTYDEVQALFDALDARVDTARTSGRKGALTALRDAVILKSVYAFGLFSRVRPVRWRLTSRVCAAQRLLGETLPAATGVVQRPGQACHWGRPGWLSWVMSSLLAARAAARSSSRSSSWSFRSRTCCSR
jgi:hypothetical protein